MTIIRIDKSIIDPYYLADYLRAGFGAIQISRLYTGSTGLIELTPDHVNSIIVNLQNKDIKKQQQISEGLRSIEKKYETTLKCADELLEKAKNFLNTY